MWGIKSNGAREIGFGGQKRFKNGGLPTMIHKRMNSLLRRLKYLRLLVEINVLMSLRGIRRDQDFRRAKP
jgi:hypothetical protein